MSRRVFAYGFAFVALAGTAGWLFLTNFSVDGLHNLQIVRRSLPAGQATNAVRTTAKRIVQSSFDATSSLSDERPAPRTVQGSRSITVATFNMESFNQLKARKLAVMDAYARILSQFDVVALQEIQSDTDDILPRLTTKLSVHGQAYDYVIGPRTGPNGATEQLGFVFNMQTIEVDRNALYTVDDRDNLLTHDPLVGWFRCRGVPTKQAFTFSLANIQVDPTRVRDEIPVLRDVMFQIRDDGRDEDDVILLGDFGPQYRKLPDLDGISDIGWAIGDVPTLTIGGGSVDNLAFQKTATPEFTGKSGVFDFLREFNLAMEQAREISDHMPVFASFSVFEGGEAGRVARKIEPTSRLKGRGFWSNIKNIPTGRLLPEQRKRRRKRIRDFTYLVTAARAKHRKGSVYNCRRDISKLQPCFSVAPRLCRSGIGLRRRRLRAISGLAEPTCR